MGCLAPGPDLLDEPIVESAPNLAFEDDQDDGTDLEATGVDLPLWYGSLVELPRPKPEESQEPTGPEPCSRLFWRSTVARWPIARRQRWGDRANALQDAGLDWKESERLAFEEIMQALEPSRL